MITKDKWVWQGHPGHFICAYDCKFFLTTRIGKYLISTVGEYFPDSAIREINAESRGVKLEGMGDARRHDYMKKIGFEELGYGRKYETMVFSVRKDPKGECCIWRQASGMELDFNGYNTPSDAQAGHMKMCLKWAKK